MKKNLFLVAITMFSCSAAFSQSFNLAFSQVINITNGQTYTVPSGKVAKIEAINGIENSLTYNFNYCFNNYCNYHITLMTIGSFVDSVSTTYFNNGCSGTCPTTYTTTSGASLPSVSLPVWLKSGQVVSLAPGSGAMISGIEFNLQ